MPTLQTTANSQSLNLDKPLVKFSQDEKDWWTIRDAVQGVQIFGGIGSGKSSGSGKKIAKTFLENGFGGLVLCAKPDERANWEKYAEETGRSDDLIIFSKNSQYEFNPLQYEMTREGEGAGEVFNLSNLFMEIYKMGNRLSGGGNNNENDRFWDTALKRCLNSMIRLIQMAEKELSISNMRRLLSSAPSEEEVDALLNMNDNEQDKLTENNYCIGCLQLAAQQVINDEMEERYYNVRDYFFKQFARMNEKTRAIIAESFLGLAEAFSDGILKKHFSKGTNITPELTHEGKIIVLDFPVKEFLSSGVYAQGIFKLLWQQATERRNIEKFPLPVFLWADESQLFISDYDQIFQTTARSSRACTVFISQNISNYYVAVGGNNSRARVDSLLGNLGTKIFHANNDAVTNEWASRVIGKDFINMTGVSTGRTESASLSKQLHYQVQPREFTTFKKGGNPNDFLVEGIVTITGREWSDGNNYKKIKFKQV